MPIPTYLVAGDIITAARAEARIGSNPVSQAFQDALYDVLSDLDNEGVAYPASVGSQGFPFLDTKTVIQTIANTTLNGAISAGASSMILTSASSFQSPSSDLRAGYIKKSTEVYDFFSYDGLSSNTLTGVTGISIAHASGDEVHQIYKLPSDFGYPRALYRQSLYYQYFNIDQAMRQIPTYNFYTTKYLKGSTYSGMFLVLPYKVGALDFTLLYQKKSTTITSSTPTQELSLPGGNARRFYIEGLKSYIFTVKGETEDATIAETKKMIALNKLLDEYCTQDMSGQAPQIIHYDW